MRWEAKAGEAPSRGKAGQRLAIRPEEGAGLQEITRGGGAAWAEPGRPAASGDESVSRKALPARQNFASTPAARHPGVGRGSGRGLGGREHVTPSQSASETPATIGKQRALAPPLVKHTRAHTHARVHTQHARTGAPRSGPSTLSPRPKQGMSQIPEK